MSTAPAQKQQHGRAYSGSGSAMSERFPKVLPPLQAAEARLALGCLLHPRLAENAMLQDFDVIVHVASLLFGVDPTFGRADSALRVSENGRVLCWAGRVPGPHPRRVSGDEEVTYQTIGYGAQRRRVIPLRSCETGAWYAADCPCVPMELGVHYIVFKLGSSGVRVGIHEVASDMVLSEAEDQQYGAQ